MNPVLLPPRYNYFGVFLTFACGLCCSYCINQINRYSFKPRPQLGAAEWLTFFKRVQLHDLPITLQGGDPGRHPGFCTLLEDLPAEYKIDLLTSLTFDLAPFLDRVDPTRFRRTGPYAPIRISYHPRHDELRTLTAKVCRLRDAGFDLGLYSVRLPDAPTLLDEAARVFASEGIDFRIKELLGPYQGAIHGTYRYPEACLGKPSGVPVTCRTSELLIDPSGNIFRCHHDLYNAFQPIGSILDPELGLTDVFRPCDKHGLCNPCDVKLKTDRYQRPGHCSVEIRPAAQDAPKAE